MPIDHTAHVALTLYCFKVTEGLQTLYENSAILGAFSSCCILAPQAFNLVILCAC